MQVGDIVRLKMDNTIRLGVLKKPFDDSMWNRKWWVILLDTDVDTSVEVSVEERHLQAISTIEQIKYLMGYR